MIDLSNSPTLKGARHWTVEINQLYHPTGLFKQDAEDLVYSFGNFNTTKFFPILLKEWFFLVEKGGYLVIDYQPNKQCDWQKLEENMWWLWKNKYDIVYHGAIENQEVKSLSAEKIKDFIQRQENYFKSNPNVESLLPEPSKTFTEPTAKNGFMRFICKKIESTAMENDSVDKWSFGVITNGTRAHWLEETIASIRKLKIPHYEIIICGTYKDRKEEDIRYIPFNQRDDKGWITKKKNLIARHAKYQNLCLFHDRIFFDENWYKGMQKWGNCFETLSVVQLSEDKKRYGDWGAMPNLFFPGNNFQRFYPIYGGSLEYRDWDKSTYGYGVIIITKKNIFLNNPLNETLYWGDYEDLVLSKEFTLNGNIFRMNPDSTVHSRTKSIFVIHYQCAYNSQKLGRVKNAGLFLRIVFYLLYILKMRRDDKIFDFLRKFIKKYYKLTTHKDFKK